MSVLASFELLLQDDQWMSHLGMDLFRLVIFLLLHVLSLRSGKDLTTLSLHGHGFLVQNNLGSLLMKLVRLFTFALCCIHGFSSFSHLFQPSLYFQVQGYLSLENICLLSLTEEDHDEGSREGAEETGCSKEEEPIDTATLVQSFGREVHFYDFHIVYSASYRVPVLYFRAYCSGGQPLALDEIEKDLPACSSKVLLASKWTFITLEEHPYLNRPWYKLHPCGTSEWVKLLFLGDSALAQYGVASRQYLVSWFSVVGQVVGLRIPFEMLNDSN
ncbi:hypothetical protein Ddye_017025 [Dipteronia dyeriana]|uniref:Ubiquitin-like-conjugating enzyme ATG10 n=1 Tax=Dipteronia dyeriana TaxID=168575 RepID=A0AAD9U8H1_9ROSI|nr:hypothetical protein Ddye_017025 [Dipteronia dyeriana]